jgi:glycosyltransferase involved in cell wall biosynthesis
MSVVKIWKRKDPGKHLDVFRPEFDSEFYIAKNPDVALRGIDPFLHYVEFGWRENRDPNPEFSTSHYLKSYPDVQQSGENPFFHFLSVGRREGRSGLPPKAVEILPQDTDAQQNALQDLAFEAASIRSEFDKDWYVSCFPADQVPDDPVVHYLQVGWTEGRDPTRWFSTRLYLAKNPDVRAAGINPFLHYLLQGRLENRQYGPKIVESSAVYKAQAFATAPGPFYEDFDPSLARTGVPKAKVIAYYLPQFHPIPENDRFWGAGFTEWRNVSRALPRYEGHIQPRIPRDMGFYTLDEGETYRRQIDLARAAGLFGFCFYYYWFNRKRVLETPIERMLADPTLDFPFCLMWANENWTRTWDGDNASVLLQQNYASEDDAALVADWARHFRDPRYIRLEGRPVLFIYRPGQIPNATDQIARWRGMLQDQYDIDPIIMMAQGFGDLDPGKYDLNGAIEFPPHKLAQDVAGITGDVTLLDPAFKGTVYSYDGLVEKAAAENAKFPLIRCVVPNWDNEPRRAGRSMTFHGSTPVKFEKWVRSSIEYAKQNPVFGETLICVNAWNEWAEGAYLEPDVHYGFAYLNALSRAVHGMKNFTQGERRKVLIVGHDAHRNGAQILALNLGHLLKSGFGVEVSFILAADGPMLEAFREVGTVEVIDKNQTRLQTRLATLAAEGWHQAITNTTVSGWALPALKGAGFEVLSLIHELERLIQSYDLTDSARLAAKFSDRLIFPAQVVADSFLGVSGPATNPTEIFPQGLYRQDLLTLAPNGTDLRKDLSLPATAQIVINVGYADMRKGIDRFITTAIAACQQNDRLVFLWVGAPAPEATDWHIPDIAAAGLSDRIRIMGHTDDVAPYYAAADIFYLTSREDPFPSVVMEAMAAGLPVVGYQGAGGCDALIDQYGLLIDPTDTAAPLKAFQTLLKRPAKARATAAATRRAVIAQDYRFDDYGFGLLQRLDPGLVSVSAIVPNYNYAAYIGDRLRTVFSQSYPLLETIVLDDKSTDTSLDVIRTVSETEGRHITLAVSEVNSGSPFAQWKNGLARARGRYVWIAEADDLAAPDLVAKLVARMEATGAAIGFCDSTTIDGQGDPLGDSYKPYMNQIEPHAFDDSFHMTGAEFLARFLAVKNVILNVSAVIFRRDALLAAMAAVGDDLGALKVAGDWRLYIALCAAGGSVVYEAAALNTHRRHQISVTHALKVDRHLEEISQMHTLAAASAPLSDHILQAQADNLAEVQAHFGVGVE